MEYIIFYNKNIQVVIMLVVCNAHFIIVTIFELIIYSNIISNISELF